MIFNLYFYNQPSRGRDSILQLDCQTFSKSEIQFYKPFLLRSLLFHLASWAPFSCLNEEAIYRYEEQPSLCIPRWIGLWSDPFTVWSVLWEWRRSCGGSSDDTEDGVRLSGPRRQRRLSGRLLQDWEDGYWVGRHETIASWLEEIE